MEDERSIEAALGEVLGSIRLETSIMSRARMRSPWSIASQALPRAVFHAVVCGDAYLRTESTAEPLHLKAGDVVLLTRGDAHVLHDSSEHDGTRAQPVALADLPREDDGTCVQTVVHGGSGDQTRLICGSFALRHVASDVMLAALPPVLHAHGRASSGMGQWLETTVSMLCEELSSRAAGAEAMVARFTDVLVMHLLRLCVDQAPERGGGWLSALRDKRIGRARNHAWRPRGQLDRILVGLTRRHVALCLFCPFQRSTRSRSLSIRVPEEEAARRRSRHRCGVRVCSCQTRS